MKPINVLILGVGDRGNVYTEYSIIRPEELKVVGIAEPNECSRNRFIKKYSIPREYIFKTWEDALKVGGIADAVLITTPDREHYRPAIESLRKGYHVLVEKPMATTERECRKMVEASRQSKKIFGVCHVLRYTPYFKKIKQIINQNIIGEIITIEHLEPVGYYHQAHSFVRGNWRNSKTTCPMILAKSCHDLDILRWLVGKTFCKISSFGSLKHFKKENAPKGSSNRCINDCEAESDCPYSALKLYLDPKITGWPVDVITDDLSIEGRIKALKEGPYGRCVYRCDNNVVDHQVVNIEFVDNVTATFTMSAFTLGNRRTRLMGTMGEIIGDSRFVEVRLFKDEQNIVYDTLEKNNYMDSKHAGGGNNGGDFGLIKEFIRAIRENDISVLSSTIEESLDSHLMAFYAEESRIKNKIITVYEH